MKKHNANNYILDIKCMITGFLVFILIACDCTGTIKMSETTISLHMLSMNDSR